MMRRRTLLAAGIAGGALPLPGCRPAVGITGSFTGISHERGHLLREPMRSPVPGITRRVHTLIAGGGVAGLAAAYDAYTLSREGKPAVTLEGLTPDQRFFLGFASVWRDQIRPEALKVQLVSDPHSPGRIRANGTPTNVPAFAAAFGCKAGDPMVNADDKRVVIW